MWKTIGDEIIFRKYISKRSEVSDTIKIWISAIHVVERKLQKMMPNIEIKCTAWIGEFPIQNRVVLGAGFRHARDIGKNISDIPIALSNFERKPVAKGLEIDFIGPAIDIGFRLSKLSTARKFVLSIDAAYFLIKESFDEPIFYEGMIKMPGVLNGLGYPVFWIDMSNDGKKRKSEKLEDHLLSRTAIDLAHGNRFCESFYQEPFNTIERPFIPTDDNPETRKVPEWYRDAINEAKASYGIKT